MTTKTVWVGKCLVHTQPIADEPHEHPWNAECYAAVWADSKPHFEQILRHHFQAQGQYLVWAEEVFSVLHWLHRHGHHPIIVKLAKTVDGTHGMELSPLVYRGKDGDPSPPATYLDITEHDIPSLPKQDRVPRWEQEWIVPELKNLLFGQPDNGEPLRTYLIVDAGLRTKITVIYDLDQLDVPVRCLVRPDKAEELRDVAPYLIDMTLPEGAWDNRSQVSEFHIDFIANHWDKGTGIIVRTPADMDEVWTHFHQFIRVQVEETQEWLFFRYWETNCTYDYFSAMADYPERINTFFITRKGNIIQNIVSYAERFNRLYQITLDFKKLASLTLTEEPFCITPVEYNALMRGVLRSYAIQMRNDIYAEYPKLPNYSEDQFIDIIQVITSIGINQTAYVKRILIISIKYWKNSLKKYQSFLQKITENKQTDPEKFFSHVLQEICQQS